MHAKRKKQLYSLIFVFMFLPGTLCAFLNDHFLHAYNAYTNCWREYMPLFCIFSDIIILFLFGIIFWSVGNMRRHAEHHIMMRYKRNGYYSVFVFMVFVAFLQLTFTGFLALPDFIRETLNTRLFSWLLCAGNINGLIQTALILIVTVNMNRKIRSIDVA